jgi:glycosyltransferase involved in cell wall biosynthesis
MRVVVHDYAGHPFQVELSRELARRGHDVLHLYSGSITTPRGALQRRPDDPSSFAVEAIELAAPIDRDRLLARRRLEGEHGARVVERIRSFRPDVLLSANAPLESQKRIAAYCHRDGVRFVYWVQDLIGEATSRVLRRRYRWLARPIVRYYRSLEQRLLAQADAVVVISHDFLSSVPAGAVVIENWAPLDDLQPRPKANDWSRAHGLSETTNVMYAGTLGMKHDPGLLLDLAKQCDGLESVRIVVVTEGRAAEWLDERRAELEATNLVLMPFQPFESLADMLGSADVLVTVLEPDAGVYSVPSKVLTYLCAGKPQLLIVPPENLAARIVERARAGVVVAPEERSRAADELRDLLSNGAQRTEMGARALAYARRAFELEPIADRFEAVLRGAR